MGKPTSDVLDEIDDAYVCELQMNCYGRRKAIEGRIRTIECLDDNALVRAALSASSLGEVLVINGHGSLRTALLGDRIASLAVTNGWAGVIVYGAIRDSALINALDFHVKAMGTCPRKSRKQEMGEQDVVLNMGAVSFHPGDYVYSDEDGIVVVPVR